MSNHIEILIHLVVKVGIRYPPASLSTLYSETGSFTKSAACCLARLDCQIDHRTSVSTPPTLRLQACAVFFCF